MNPPHAAPIGILLALAAGALATEGAGTGTRMIDGEEGGTISFNRDVRPILADKCFACHGPDSGAREAGLRLDRRDSATGDLGDYAAIVPGDLDGSELAFRIRAEEDERMPPASWHKSLDEEEKRTLERWIEQGAAYEGHWAYRLPERAALPVVQDASWPRSPVDFFVLHGLEERGIAPAPDADPRVLLRRLSQDLTGLPPTPEDVDVFVGQDLDQTIEPTVERLLASPHHAERLAVQWLDLVRYADTVGYHGDQDCSMSPYRDYVINAFAENMPFDRFVTEQLAGDLLDEPTLQQQIASAFNRLNQITAEGGAQDKEYLAIYAADRVRTTATVFLGSTLACAQCHDHKFDPFTTEDFYSFASFFADIEERGVFNGANDDGNWGPSISVPTPEDEAQIHGHETELARLDRILETPTPELEAEQSIWEEALRAKLPSTPADFDWVDDEQKNGGTTEGAWTFVGADVVEIHSGEQARKQVGEGTVQHFFHGAERTVRIGPEDRFFTHVWLNADAPPATIMLQIFANQNWEHRAYWGEDKISFGGIGQDTPGHRHQGPLPEAGGWARLEVDAASVGLVAGDVVTGMAFTQYGGLVYWDRSGLHAQNPLHSVEGVDIATQELVGGGPGERSPDDREALASLYRSLSPALDPTRADRATAAERLQTARAAIATCLVTRATEPRPTHILPRGNWMDDSGTVVEPAVPAFLPQPPKREGERLNRLDLADWVVDASNPLTARVFVNRIWSMLFGQGLVHSPGDFGAQGDWPDHPGLLDWLAVEFVESGWDVRHIIRVIATSRTYRQSSSATPASRQLDPDNRSFSRQSSFRIDAEFVRDNALAVSGLLNRAVGGKSVKPYQPPGFWRELNFPMRTWQHDASADGLRRGLYTYWCRTFLHPSLAAFDAASREECTVERPRSNIPQQALVLLNDPIFIEAARALALRILDEAPAEDGARIDFAFRVVLQRAPRPGEKEILLELLEAYPATDAGALMDPAGVLALGDHAPLGEHYPALVARWIPVARALLNLHELITRY